MSNNVQPKEVKVLRGRLGLSQSKLAEILRCHWTTVSRWELGKSVPIGVQADMLRLLQRLALSVEDAKLVGEEIYNDSKDNQFFHWVHVAYRRMKE